MTAISVLTIVRNREPHLANLIAGLSRSDHLPSELVVVDMSDRPVVLAETPFPSRRIALSAKGGLALAEARNIAAANAASDFFLFLDVDCIPSRELVGSMMEALLLHDAIICADVRYLGAPTPTSEESDTRLLARSRAHPVRSFPEQGLRTEPNPGLLWSLAFGVRRATFDLIGGFDAGFTGYGGEDTDFGFRAHDAGIPLLFMGGPVAFHQYHGVIAPPVQHFEDIVRNAHRFHSRWGIWPMQDWLMQFDAMGLVRFDGLSLERKRMATNHDIATATQPSGIYF